MSGGDPPPQVGGKQRKVSPPSAPAAAAPRRNYAIRTRRGLSPPAGRRESGRAREPSTSLLTHWEEESAARRPHTPRVPPSGRPSASLSLAHTRAGTGRTPQQSARGGRGAPPPRSPPSAAGCPETPPPAARLLSPPPFPPGLMDESRMLREPAFPLGRRRERERAPGTAGRVLRARPGTAGGSPSPQGRAGATGAYCKESLLQIRSFKVSRLSGGIGFLLGSPPSWYKTYPLAHSLAKRPQATFILSLFVFPTSKPACISRCADGRHPGGLDNS